MQNSAEMWPPHPGPQDISKKQKQKQTLNNLSLSISELRRNKETNSSVSLSQVYEYYNGLNMLQIFHTWNILWSKASWIDKRPNITVLKRQKAIQGKSWHNFIMGTPPIPLFQKSRIPMSTWCHAFAERMTSSSGWLLLKDWLRESVDLPIKGRQRLGWQAQQLCINPTSTSVYTYSMCSLLKKRGKNWISTKTYL